MQYYKNIHPGKFYKANIDGIFETKIPDEQVKILDNVFLSFKNAEYYFAKIATEYPASEWAHDAKEKLKLLEKLHKSYEHINANKNNHIIHCNQFVAQMGLSIM
jgi:hypothetical protein